MRFRHRERPGFQHGKRDVLVCDLQVDERAPGGGFLSLRKLAIDQAISAGFDEAMIVAGVVGHPGVVAYTFQTQHRKQRLC